MATPVKPPTLAVVQLTDWGHAEVEFPEKDLRGRIERQGVQSYIAFAEDGSRAGQASRYESAARVLAAHLGIRRKHMITVKIIDGIPRKVPKS